MMANTFEEVVKLSEQLVVTVYLSSGNHRYAVEEVTRMISYHFKVPIPLLWKYEEKHNHQIVS